VADTAQGQDVVDVLSEDHQEFLSLIESIKSTDDPEQRRDLADTVIAQLVRHSVAEEMFVYPAMEKHLPDGESASEHDKEEHEQLERTMKELEGVDAGDARFLELVEQLEDQLRHHVEDEEEEQFPQLRQHIPADDLVDLAGKVEKAKKAAPTRPHPSAPNTAAFHKTLGPGAGLVDRARDKLSGRSTG
jgi:hemerythrin superfamily protein